MEATYTFTQKQNVVPTDQQPNPIEEKSAGANPHTEEGLYIMECFRDIRTRKGKKKKSTGKAPNIELLIKWVDYEEQDNTWEPINNISNPDTGITMLEEFKPSITTMNVSKDQKDQRLKLVEKARSYFISSQDMDKNDDDENDD